ncbi:hypothetical protein BABINDRAFT_160010 [Babjeviella inositovora NRRL Y-12698]|uniref:Catalase n=1 Tax=Babjeviella inositovora NRRL Y-12698 TaxID=984486 RepID=A0A1E3QVT1_9ASCO|nr:uncharacterized protein BABINDRAFT_160010 [Babjeviella inositovora NRRL Y-12698]ODQ81770.1 hypothetical protein BABINDRAFT_160010 [Babjeviella inositovora NRRL Y-12698]
MTGLKAASKDSTIYATSNGVPYVHHPYGAQTSRPGGPLLLQDFHLLDSLSHFDRERIPERVVHAKGGGAHGYFELTDSLEDITIARPFTVANYKCPISIRFSTVGGERGTPDTLRDPRGFSIKFRTDIGNMDWVFNNTPVFFLRDPNKFPHFIHTQKRDPASNLGQNSGDSTHTWDYYLQNPETLHQVTYMFGDRGTPAGWGEMNGYSGHTFKFTNAEGKLTYVQIHVLADSGFQTLSGDQANELAGSSPDYNTSKLYHQIEKGEFPSWTLAVQTMTPEQAENFRYSVNDLTKIWPHKDFPLRKFGKIVLNQNPKNYHAEIEQIAFSPSHLVPGIDPSNDPVLQSRLFSYPDTHRHRLGANYQQLPVNRARTFETDSEAAFQAGNFQRDGPATVISQDDKANFLSLEKPINSADTDASGALKFGKDTRYIGLVAISAEQRELAAQQAAQEREHDLKIWENSSYFYLSGLSELDLEQPRDLYERVYNDEDKKDFIKAVVLHASNVHNPDLKETIPQYFGLLNRDLGAAVAKGLGVKYTHLSLDEYAQKLGLASNS